MQICWSGQPHLSRLFKTVVVFTCFLLHMNGYGQSMAFNPAVENQALLNTLSLKHEQLYKEELNNLPSENKKDLEAIYRQRWDHIKKVFDSKEIYTSDTAQQYLDALVAEIVKANPLLQQRAFNCYFSRSGIPNASYIGEGIILFNMGLFRKLNSESEVVFVIGHEIAHYFLRHGENSIDQYVSTINSPEVQEELKKIKGTEYRKRTQLEKLVKGLTFDTRRHSRDHESEADSMSLELMRNTRFDLSGALSALALLDDIDKDTLNTAVCLESMFNAKAYPFKKKWIARNEGLLGGHTQLENDEKMEDSLKTHPDCKSRIRLLEPFVAKYQAANAAKNVVNEVKFEALKNTFSYEIVEYAFISEKYTQSLFYTIGLLQDNPSDVYLITQVGRVLNSCYAAQKSHTLGRKVELPSPAYPANYNLLLQFIQNLYIEEYAILSYHYLNQYHPQFNYYKGFEKEYATSVRIIKQ